MSSDKLSTHHHLTQVLRWSTLISGRFHHTLKQIYFANLQHFAWGMTYFSNGHQEISHRIHHEHQLQMPIQGCRLMFYDHLEVTGWFLWASWFFPFSSLVFSLFLLCLPFPSFLFSVRNYKNSCQNFNMRVHIQDLDLGLF